jgi:serum/glucocorticoid-regulated kinase 2
MVTNLGVYNLKGNSIKYIYYSAIRRKIDIDKIKAITISRIGTEFVLHVPEEYDYRYASSDKRDKIIYCILKGYCTITKAKMPIYIR